jgi:hypothetical protein
MWSVPLYLFASVNRSDTVLLPKSPAVYAPIGGYDDYYPVYTDPVAFAHELTDEAAYPFVTYKLFWSEERNDFQTSTWTTEDLNTHGGNYDWVADIALLASNLSPGNEASVYTPLLSSYDDMRADSVAAPLSFTDLNMLSELEISLQVSPTYRLGHRLGYAYQADCVFCNISMSEAFPSAGGADCAHACAADESCQGTKYLLGNMPTVNAKSFDASMRRAGEILMQYGDASVTYGSGLHMSVDYFCCYNSIDFDTIHAVLESYSWPEVNVTFDRPVWRVDSDAEDADHYSLIVLLDEGSEAGMQALVAGVEAAVRAAGVDIHVPRQQQEPFHSTLAVVNGTSYPCSAGLDAVNAAIPPGQWTSAGPIAVSKPDFDW